jgi:PAS domain-containing protein
MAKEMKRLKPTVPIILRSGTTDRPESFENIDAFISKAEGPDSLLAKVTQLIARSEAASASRIPDLPTVEEPFSTEAQRFQLLASIVESSDDAIFSSKTLDGTILSWNKAAERTYGYRSEEIIGKPVSILLSLLTAPMKCMTFWSGCAVVKRWITLRRCVPPKTGIC